VDLFSSRFGFMANSNEHGRTFAFRKWLASLLREKILASLLREKILASQRICFITHNTCMAQVNVVPLWQKCSVLTYLLYENKTEDFRYNSRRNQ
jgi:hypothetical protein